MNPVLEFFRRLNWNLLDTEKPPSASAIKLNEDKIGNFGTVQDWYRIKSEFVDCHTKFRLEKLNHSQTRPWLDFVAKVALLRSDLDTDAETAFSELAELSESLVELCESDLYEKYYNDESLIELLRIGTSLHQHSIDTLLNDECEKQIEYTQILLGELEQAFYEVLKFRSKVTSFRSCS